MVERCEDVDLPPKRDGRLGVFQVLLIVDLKGHQMPRPLMRRPLNLRKGTLAYLELNLKITNLKYLFLLLLHSLLYCFHFRRRLGFLLHFLNFLLLL